MICHWVQRRISACRDDGSAPSAWVRRHLRRCGTCREFEAFSAALETRLVREAAGFRAAPAPRVVTASVWAPRLASAFALAAAVLIAVAGVGLWRSWPAGNGSGPAESAGTGPVLRPEGGSELLAEVGELLAGAGALLTPELALEQEFDRLLMDTQRAVACLATVVPLP